MTTPNIQNLLTNFMFSLFVNGDLKREIMYTFGNYFQFLVQVSKTDILISSLISLCTTILSKEIGSILKNTKFLNNLMKVLKKIMLLLHNCDPNISEEMRSIGIKSIITLYDILYTFRFRKFFDLADISQFFEDFIEIIKFLHCEQIKYGTFHFLEFCVIVDLTFKEYQNYLSSINNNLENEGEMEEIYLKIIQKIFVEITTIFKKKGENKSNFEVFFLIKIKFLQYLQF